MSSDARFDLGRLIFDAPAGELATHVQRKRLEPKAAAVLAVLCDQRGTVVSRQMLLDQCWGEGEGSDEALTQAVAQIRRAIEELGERPDMIETLAKRGYRLREAEPQPQNLLPKAGLEPAVAHTRKSRWGVVAVAVIVILTATWIMLPHGPRHFIKHAFGAGPSSNGGH